MNDEAGAPGNKAAPWVQRLPESRSVPGAETPDRQDVAAPVAYGQPPVPPPTWASSGPVAMPPPAPPAPGTGPWPQQQWPQQQWLQQQPQQQWPQHQPPPPVAPPPGHNRNRTALLVTLAVALVVVLVVAGGVTWFLVGQRGTDTAAAGKAGPIAANSSQALPSDAEDAGTTAVDPVPEPEPTTLPPEPTADPEEEALLSLGELRQESVANLDLDGRWVAQVASKYVGITDPLQVAQNGSHTFYALDILAEMDDAATRAPSAQMFVLNGSDFGRYSMGPQGQEFWVTLVDAGFASSAEVDAWCASTYADLTVEQRENTCAARTLVPSFR